MTWVLLVIVPLLTSPTGYESISHAVGTEIDCAALKFIYEDHWRYGGVHYDPFWKPSAVCVKGLET